MPRPTVLDDAVRARLLAAAAAAIAEHGAAGLSLRKVAARADTSTTAVYTLFGDRAQLVGAVAREAERSFIEAQRRSVAELGVDTDPVEQLRSLGVAYRAWALGHPDLYAVMFAGGTPRPEDDECAESGMAPLLEAVQRLDGAGILQEGGSPEGVSRAALLIWASTHGFVRLERDVWSAVPAAERDRWFASHLDGIQRAWVVVSQVTQD